MQAKYDALMKNNTYSLVSCPNSTNGIGFKWIYSIKRMFVGSIEIHKAQLVTQWFSQEVRVDLFDTFSLVIKPTIIRLVLSISISQG